MLMFTFNTRPQNPDLSYNCSCCLKQLVSYYNKNKATQITAARSASFVSLSKLKAEMLRLMAIFEFYIPVHFYSKSLHEQRYQRHSNPINWITPALCSFCLGSIIWTIFLVLIICGVEKKPNSMEFFTFSAS